MLAMRYGDVPSHVVCKQIAACLRPLGLRCPSECIAFDKCALACFGFACIAVRIAGWLGRRKRSGLIALEART